MKKYLPFIILIFFVSVIAAATYKINKKQEIKSDKELSLEKTKIILPNFSLQNLFDKNQIFNNATLQKKYSLINFFASWCTTCRAEHDILLRLKSENIIDIYGVAFRDIDENTKKFLDEHGNPYTMIAKDPQGLFSKLINLNAVPETLLIDPEGNIAARYQGNLQEDAIEEIKGFLR